MHLNIYTSYKEKTYNIRYTFFIFFAALMITHILRQSFRNIHAHFCKRCYTFHLSHGWL